MLHLCGYDGDSDIKIGPFLCLAYKHHDLFQSFLQINLLHYDYRSDKSTAGCRVSLGLTDNNHTRNMRNILDLLSYESRKQLTLARNCRPRMFVADAIGLLIYLETNPPWYICEALHWGSPEAPDKTTPLGEQRVQALAYVIRWLVGLGPCEVVPEEMAQDVRPMWGRVRWLRVKAGWQGWDWFSALWWEDFVRR